MDKFKVLNFGQNDLSGIQKFEMMTAGNPPSLCIRAALDLQIYLQNQKDWNHNFGLNAADNAPVAGKMFGVLVVKTIDGQIGYLAAFSGKLAGTNRHAKFVPPVFDLLEEGSFFNVGMQQLNEMNNEVKALETSVNNGTENEEIARLKNQRKLHSFALQQKIFEQYYFINKAGEEKSLNQLFSPPHYKSPPAGAGECAGPKLLQYAFKHHMHPLALAEFWWGQSPKSATWKHGEFYPCCKEKCAPILAFMLAGINA